MLKKIKHFTMGALFLSLCSMLAFFIFDKNFNTNKYDDNVENGNTANNETINVRKISRQPELVLFKNIVESGSAFDADLLKVSHIFMPNELEYLSKLSKTGVEPIQQIKAEFLEVKNQIFFYENLVKNSILRHWLRIYKLQVALNIKHIEENLFKENYHAALLYAKNENFYLDKPLTTMKSWRDKLNTYIVILDIIDQYL